MEERDGRVRWNGEKRGGKGVREGKMWRDER
jgi:hypothetical protein